MAAADNSLLIGIGPATGLPWSGAASHYVGRRGNVVLFSRQFLDSGGNPTTIDAPAQIGQSMVFDPNTLTFTLNPALMAGFTEDGAGDMLSIYFTNVPITIALHTAAPGGNFNQNEMTGPGYARATVSAGTITIP